MAAEADRLSFKNGIDVAAPRRMRPDFGCAALLYAAIIVQFVLIGVILGSKNAEVVKDESGLLCSEGYQEAEGCGEVKGSIYLGNTKHLCVTQELCREIFSCAVDRYSESERLWPTRRLETLVSEAADLAANTDAQPSLVHAGHNPWPLAKRSLREDARVPESFWILLEEHAERALALFCCIAALGTAWLFLLPTAPKVAVWGSFAAASAFLCVVLLWYLMSFGIGAWVCIVGLAALALGVCLAWRSKPDVDAAASIMRQAALGLRTSGRTLAVVAAVQALWVLCLALWMAAVFGVHHVLRVTPDAYYLCELEGRGVLGSGWLALPLTLCCYWMMHFARSISFTLVAANVAGWYFQQASPQNFWLKVLPWSISVQAGGTALASSVAGMSEYAVSRVGSTWDLLFSLPFPYNWPPLALACVFQTSLQACSRFSLIAMTFSGRSYRESSRASSQLLQSALVKAVLRPYLGCRILAWAGYMIALGTAMAAWAWSNEAQGISTAEEVDYTPTFFLTFTLALAYILSFPFLTLVAMLLLESNRRDLVGSSDMESFNSALVALFVGSITMLILEACLAVVVDSVDAVLFCFAVEMDNKGQQERFAELYSSIDRLTGKDGAQGDAEGRRPRGPMPERVPAVMVVEAWPAPGQPAKQEGDEAGPAAAEAGERGRGPGAVVLGIPLSGDTVATTS